LQPPPPTNPSAHDPPAGAAGVRSGAPPRRGVLFAARRVTGELEPAGLRARFHGLRVVPCRIDMPDASMPKSGMVVLPRMRNGFRRDHGATTAASSLPARSAVAGVHQARRALHREPLDAADVPCPSTRRAAAPGPMPVARSAARPSMPARWRAAPRSSPASPAGRSTRAARCRRRAGASRRAMPLRRDRCRWRDRLRSPRLPHGGERRRDNLVRRLTIPIQRSRIVLRYASPSA
jgi:hypothetical protein